MTHCQIVLSKNTKINDYELKSKFLYKFYHTCLCMVGKLNPVSTRWTSKSCILLTLPVK